MKIFGILAGILFSLSIAGVSCADPGKGTAQSSGLYLSLTPSVIWPFSVDTKSSSLSPGRTRTRWGEGISGGLGYRTGDFRLEGEMMYGRSDADRIDFSGGGGDLSGYYDFWSATLNLYYDVPTGTKFRPYVGAGAGGVLFDAHDLTLTGFAPTRGRNTLYTYRLMAGVSYVLTDAWRLILGYRYIAMSGQDYETGGVSLHGDPIQMHTVQTGLQYYF